MKRFVEIIFAVSLGLPALAQVSWIASGPGSSASPIYSSPEGLRVCRVVNGGNTYGGQERGGQCYYIQSGAATSSGTYEVAVGLGKWEAPGLSGAATLGTIGGLPTRVCRARVGTEWVSGYTENAGVTCRMAAAGGTTSATKFELLYDFAYSGNFHVMHNGLCVTARVGQSPPVRLEACSDLPADQWKLTAATGGYRLESALFAGQCLNGQNLAACGSAPVFAMESFNDRLVKFRQASTLLHLTRSTPGKTTGASLALQTVNDGFEVLTLAEASRRLSVMSYNVMMLPDDQFPGLMQDERAGWIPASLNRLGALADVIGFQEGFQTSARNQLTSTLLTQHRYLWYTGVSDWPDVVYDTEWLNTVVIFSGGSFRLFTNGGAFISSRWPIEKTGYYKFGSFSTDGIFDTTGFDAFAAKGISYARVQKLGRRYHIFNTHLQAGDPDDEAQVRQSQLQEMKIFSSIMLAGASPDDGVVFTGDFNIDMETDVANYFYMLDALQVNFVDAPRPIGSSENSTSNVLWTVNSMTNQTTRMRDSKKDAQGNLLFNKKWLDYVFIGRQNAQPDLASYEVFQPKHDIPYILNVSTLATESPSVTFDLSDHDALLARFRFPPTASSVTPPEVVPVLFRSTYEGSPLPEGAVVVNGGTITTPSTIELVRNEPVAVTAPTFLAGGTGTRYRFRRWANLKPQTFDLIPVPNMEEQRADYSREFEVKANIVPAGAGTISGTGFFADDGETTVTATAAPGFAFVNLVGERTTTSNTLRVRSNRPQTVTANFVATGAPRLSLLTEGPRVDTVNGLRRVNFKLVNSGAGGAVNARATLLSATTLAGSGTVTLPGGQSANFGTLPAGQTSAMAAPLDFVWPATATRVRLVLQIVADGGYSTTVTLTLIR